VDFVTLNAALAQAGELDAVGGPAYMAALVDGVPRATNVEHYARIVKNASRARTIIASARSAIEIFSRDPAALSNGQGESFLAQVRDVVAAAHEDTGLIEDSLSQDASAFLAAAPDAPSPLVKGLVPGSGINLQHGQPRGRKSIVILATQLAAAVGDAPFGLARLEVAAPIVCWYLTEEDNAGELKKRVRELLAGSGAVEPPVGFRLSAQKGLTLDDVRTQDRIIREILKHGVQVLALDPIRAISSAVDKGPSDLQPLVKCLRRIMRETGVVLQIAHHDTKPRNDGKPDDRPRAQRASGGGILSISEAPIHVERVSDDVTLLVPSLWKFSEDPPPIKVRFERGPGWTRLVGENVDACAAESLAVHERVLSVLVEHPGAAGNAIAKYAHMRREAVYQALDDLSEAGKVDSVKTGRAVRWFLKGDS
jgi:hypothetical protein